MKRPFFFAFTVLLLGLVAGLGFYWPFRSRREVLKVPGIVEIQEVLLGPRVGGRVKEILVSESDQVKANQELVRLEIPELEAQRDMLLARIEQARSEYTKANNGPRQQEIESAKAAVDAARARLLRLERGFREEEKRQVKSELEAARADERLSTEEFQRAVRLLRNVASSQADYDTARANLERAKGRVATAKAKYDLYLAGSRAEDINEARAEVARLQAQLKLLREGTRPEDIAAAQARLREAEASLAQLEVNLREAVVRAAEPCLVELVMVRKGSLVQPNQPVVRVLRSGDMWVKTYIPETDLGKVRLGQRVQVTMDSFPNVRFDAKIVQIGNESEFTPRNVQTVDERRHQMFGLRVRIEDTKGVFKSGMAAEVHIPVQESVK